MKLISMTDFVLEQRKRINETVATILNSVFKYADFLKQPLELWMFVPCDKDGNVLEEPDVDYYMNVTEKELKEYQEAKERVLFEGIEYVKAKQDGYVSYLRITELGHINFPVYFSNLLVEYIVKYNLELTPTAKKQIGL